MAFFTGRPVHRNTIIILTFTVYLAALLIIGLAAYLRTRDLNDYILGGRRLGSAVAALSAGASDMSGWLLLGLPGYAYLAGLEAGWIALGLLAGTYLNWRVIAKRLRNYTALADDAITLPAFFERRFDDSSRLLRILSAFFILLFFMFYTSSGLVAGGKLFTAVFDLPYKWAVLTGALAIVIYTFLGGFLAVSWTDLIQALLMLFALVAVPVIGFHYVGGWHEVQATMAQIDPTLLKPLTDSGDKPLTAVAVISLLAWGLGYFGQPHILARFMAIDSPDHVPRARRIATGWAFISMLGALLVGFSGIGIFQQSLADSEKVFIILVEYLFHPIPAGICLAAIMAAIMSTADSQLLVSASALTEDFYKALFRPNAGQKELVLLGRLTVLALAVAAAFLALNPESKVLDLVAYAWAGFGAAFGPAVILSLFWRRMTRNGALAGILTGGLTVIAWKQLSGGLFDLYEIVPGFAFSAAAIIIFSLLGQPPTEKTTLLFDTVAAGAYRT